MGRTIIKGRFWELLHLGAGSLGTALWRPVSRLLPHSSCNRHQGRIPVRALDRHCFSCDEGLGTAIELGFIEICTSLWDWISNPPLVKELCTSNRICEIVQVRFSLVQELVLPFQEAVESCYYQKISVSFHLKQNFNPEFKSQTLFFFKVFPVGVNLFSIPDCPNHLKNLSTVCSRAVCSLTLCAQVHRGRHYPLHWRRARWSQRKGSAPRRCFKVSIIPFYITAFITFGEPQFMENTCSLEWKGCNKRLKKKHSPTGRSPFLPVLKSLCTLSLFESPHCPASAMFALNSAGQRMNSDGEETVLD